jgi:hypothetical protein
MGTKAATNPDTQPMGSGVTVGDLIMILSQHPLENEVEFGSSGHLTFYRVSDRDHTTRIEFHQVDSCNVTIHDPE